MAFSQPYTFTDLQMHFQALENSPNRACYLTKELLCYTLLENPCDILTITSTKSTKGIQKKGVIFTARVHPGETVGSWMIKGVIDFLLSEDKIAEQLRDNYVFKIVPMLNPDGVIQGNYRSSIMGYDLNRRYLCPSKTFHSTIFYVKRMAKQFSKEYPLVLYCDLHGHSKNKKVFMYGNTDDENPSQYRIFPFIMSKVYPYFSFKSSRFNVHKSKLSTARVTMWKELGIPSIFTIEASFFGTNEKKDDPHFEAKDYMEMGKAMCKALSIYEMCMNETLYNLNAKVILIKFIAERRKTQI